MKKKLIEAIVIGVLLSWLLVPVLFNARAAQPNVRLVPIGSTHYTWNQTFGGIQYDEGTSIVQTADGGFACAGRTASFGAVEGVDEVWLVRCNANGTPLWNHTYGGGMTEGGYLDPFHKSVRLENTTDGGFLISSHTNKYSIGDADGWLIRIDANGNHLWNYTYGGPDDEFFVETVECSSGGFISSAIKQNRTIGNVDYWLIRTDANGNHVWNYTYGSPTFGEVCYGVIEVSTGGFLLNGWAGDFDTVDDPERFNVDVGCWLVRVDAAGNHLWNHTYGIEHTGTYAVECQDGGFAFIGTKDEATTDGSDVILFRLNANGQHLWNRTYGDAYNEAALEFAECSDGGFAIFTLNYLTSTWSNGWFIRTNSNGTALWNQTYGGNQFDQFWAGTITSQGDFALIGMTNSYGAGRADMWVMRIPDEPPPVPPPTPPPIPLLVYGVIAVIVVTVIVAVVLLYRRRN